MKVFDFTGSSSNGLSMGKQEEIERYDRQEKLNHDVKQVFEWVRVKKVNPKQALELLRGILGV